MILSRFWLKYAVLVLFGFKQINVGPYLAISSHFRPFLRYFCKTTLYDNDSTDSSGSSSTTSIDSVVETPENNKISATKVNESVYAEVDLNKKHLQRNNVGSAAPSSQIGNNNSSQSSGNIKNIPKSIQNPEIAELAQEQQLRGSSPHNHVEVGGGAQHARQGSGNPQDEFETLQPPKGQGLVNLHQHHKYAAQQNYGKNNQQPNFSQNQMHHPNAFRSTTPLVYGNEHHQSKINVDPSSQSPVPNASSVANSRFQNSSQSSNQLQQQQHPNQQLQRPVSSQSNHHYAQCGKRFKKGFLP